VEERLKAKEISLSVTPEVYDFLAKEGYNPQYGARPLRRLIQNKILNPIATLIISRGLDKGGTVSLTLKNKEIQFDVRKGRNGRSGNGNGYTKAVKSEVVTEQPVETAK
jgi:ATP-dependent Clp protease ATP-binding subunit ClpA